jgi:hypothetical protein
MKKLLLSVCVLSFLTVTASAQFIGNLVINEFVASNTDSTGGFQEPDGGFGDYVELYNNGNVDLDLEGINFSDDLTELDKWAIPAGVTIEAGGYLIIWADNDPDQTGIHATFNLSRGGEDVVLSQNGDIIDAYTYGPQETNVAEARVPNGTGDFVKQTPTPLANNQSSSTREPATLRLNAFPNPTADALTIEMGTERFNRYEVVNLTGAVVMSGILTGGVDKLSLNVSSLAHGQYQLIFDGGKAAASFTRQ